MTQFFKEFFQDGNKPKLGNNTDFYDCFFYSLKEAISLRQLDFIKPAPYAILHYEFRRDKFFIWFLRSGMIDMFLKNGIIFPDKMIEELTKYGLQPANRKKKNAPHKPNSRLDIIKRIKTAITPRVEEMILNPLCTITNIKKDKVYRTIVRDIKASFNKPDKQKVDDYPSDTALRRLATELRAKNNIKHIRAAKD